MALADDTKTAIAAGTPPPAITPPPAPGGLINFLRQHPTGFWFIFWGEFAERCSYYGMRAILATYMARRPPAFVRNLAGARHVNIAHGLYPREPLPPAALDGLAAYLRRSVTPGQGRTYAGGLTKFEPREMERLPVPAPALLPAYAPAALAVPATPAVIGLSIP